ncbi:MAG: beta-propeller domain-containing protein [Eubacteriales bacterium]|nr:beta-propeller domain-containing protein [Eubacteriales bacterium]
MDEKKWNERIRKSAEEIPVPDSLSPENIEKRLKETEQKPAGEEQGKERKKVIPWYKYGVRAAEAAAVLFLVFAAGRQLGVTQTMRGIENKAGAEQKQADDALTADTLELAADEGAANATETADELEGAANAAKSAAADTGLAPIGDKTALYEKLKEFVDSRSGSGSAADGGIALYEESGEIMALDSAAGMAKSVQTESVADGDAGQALQNVDFSQTNLRELGVDEGDIVKTDGEYIYILKQNNSLRIVRADGTEMEQVCELTPEDLSSSVLDMYIDGDLLSIITGGSLGEMRTQGDQTYYVQTRDYTRVTTYDISSREEPKLLGSMEQEGDYYTSRKVGDYIYTFTQYWPQVEKDLNDSEIMPLVNGEEVGTNRIFVPEKLEDTGYLVISSVNIKEPEKVQDYAAVVSGVSSTYVSGDSIFVCNREWRNMESTEILKFSYEDGAIKGVGACKVEGYLNDTFSIDEYEGYLRVVTTRWEDGGEMNGLYVFDENLHMTGKINDIAPGETIRSARFLGDTGYFVTFRQTDPLFSVDLSDPSDPKILGELKVTGFSSYLHFYGENMLLGIGYEADPDTGATQGVKLSMFDISDPSNVTEVDKYVIKNASYCPGLSNYKAIMINQEKNIFGFVCDSNYLVFSYREDTGFENLLTYDLSAGRESIESQYGWYDYSDVRGLYIGNTFYLVEADLVKSFDMENGFSLSSRLEL